MKSSAVRGLKAAAHYVMPAWLRYRVGRRLSTLGYWKSAFHPDTPLIVNGPPARSLEDGWKDPAVPARQARAIDPLLEQMRAGHPRADFAALADAVRRTTLANPTILEVGCAYAWNADVLDFLLGRPVSYLGLDYSMSMLSLARARHPSRRLVGGDACALPLRDRSFDIVVSGTNLLHVLDYAAAIRESRRVARRWCVFHTVPITDGGATFAVTKAAYGNTVVEWVFDDTELQALFSREGLLVRDVFPSIEHEYMSPILGRAAATSTYLCECHP